MAQIDEWLGCYKGGWKGLICDEAFAHPAKYSRKLIEHIYEHVIAEGWARPGDSVVDPFGGVALGGFDAMRHGLNWTGCELEAKFVGLGNQNIDFWNERFSRLPQWGTARLLQGDSRNLASVIREAQCCVSSPPYIESLKPETEEQTAAKQRRIAESKSRYDGRKLEQPSPGKAGLGGGYGITEGNLGAMPPGDLCVTSPPYVGSLANAKNYADPEKAQADSEREFMQHRSSTYADLRYGETEGNLGAMPEGQLAITSPPYAAISPEKSSKSVDYEKQYATYRSQGGGASFEKFVATQKLHSGGYGNSEGQLSAMEAAGFAAAVSSPPWESVEGANAGKKHKDPAAVAKKRSAEYASGKLKGHQASEAAILAQFERENEYNYGNSEGQLGVERGETFWSASRTILEQLYEVLAPGSHAVFVVKAFVRNKQIVDFPGQWAQLCEAVGFKLLHDHHALLTEEYGEQHRLDGGSDITTVARKSFFRRLAESKGSPRIDFENVLCFERPFTPET
jgi:hypothetical protein